MAVSVGTRIAVGMPKRVNDAVRPSPECIVEACKIETSKGAMRITITFIPSKEIKEAIFGED